YNNSKAALISFTKGFANEVIKDNIRVNGVAPGCIMHPTSVWSQKMRDAPEDTQNFIDREIPSGRMGTAEEVASCIVFLASNKSSWISGATINIDGGQSKMNF